MTAEVLAQKSRGGLPEHPDEFGPALAHVVHVEGDKEVLLGQAWIAGANKLVTCGHVVDQFVHRPHELNVVFPASGKRYTVRGIKLHPSFVRQPDQLINYDAAVVYVDLQFPESNVSPLPIQFEKSFVGQQALSAIRYPVHLGQLAGSSNPLAQLGRFLGPLRKHDNFHLLHDLALAPGDSGAPIFDGTTVVAIHCGDTATLPGLNLPTTAIRMALWVDALRELGVSETYVPPLRKAPSGLIRLAVIAFALSFLVGIGLLGFLSAGDSSEWQVKQPEILPIDVTFNKPIRNYRLHDNVSITLTPRSPCDVYLFYVDGPNVMQLFPQGRGSPHLESFIEISHFGQTQVQAGPGDAKLYLLALNSPKPPLEDRCYKDDLHSAAPLKINTTELERCIEARLKEEPQAIFVKLDAPSARDDSQ